MAGYNPQTPDTHALVARLQGDQKFTLLESFPSYDEALIAFAQAEKTQDQYPKVQYYAVRSVADPQVRKLSAYGPSPEKLYKRSAVEREDLEGP